MICKHASLVRRGDADDGYYLCTVCGETFAMTGTNGEAQTTWSVLDAAGLEIEVTATTFHLLDDGSLLMMTGSTATACFAKGWTGVRKVR